MALTGVCCGPAVAQIEEITVTVRKKDENLQDVPLSISAFNEDTILQQGITRTEDLSRVTPGLFFSQGLGGGATKPDIRGLSPTRGRTGVAILVDGVDVTTDSTNGTGGGAALNLELFDLERIEVVRGPQSALYGRNAFSGAISYITKRPTDEFEGTAISEIAEYGSVTARGNISGPLIPGKLLSRFGISHAQTDGQYKNAVDGNDLGSSDTDAVALAFTLNPDSTLVTNLRLDYAKQKMSQGALHPFANNACALRGPGPITISMDFSLCADRNDPATSDWKQLLVGDVPDIGEGEIALSSDDFLGTRNDIFQSTLRFDWELPVGDLVTIASYTHGEYTEDFDFDTLPDGVPATGISTSLFPASVSSSHNDLDTDRNVYFLDTRLSGSAGEHFDWLIGGEYYLENWDRVSYGRYADYLERPAPGQLPAGSLPVLPTDKVDALPSNSERKTETWGVYGSVDINLNEYWTVTTALRYQPETISWYSQAICLSCEPQVPYPDFVATDFDEKDTFKALSPSFTLRYTPNDSLMSYFTIAKGSKPGGFTAQGSLTEDARSFDQESLWNYELGSKFSWSDKLILSSSIYYMDNGDRQVQARQNTFVGPVTYTINAGKVKIKGLELESTWMPTDKWSFSFAYTFIDSTYDQFLLPQAIGSESAADPDADLSGKYLMNTPRHSLYAYAQHLYPVLGDYDLITRVDANYRSKTYLDDENYSYIPSSTRVNGQFGIQHDQWELVGFVDNVFNDDTPSSGFAFVNFPNDLQRMIVAYPASLRVVGVRGRINF